MSELNASDARLSSTFLVLGQPTGTMLSVGLAEDPKPQSLFTDSGKEREQMPKPSSPHLLVPFLRRPLLPIIHLAIISTHLGVSATIPYLLITNLIQPMALWLILTVCLALEIVYLLPGLVLDCVGLIRGRPIESAWLQSGVYLVINILTLIPQSLAIWLLINADELPPCPSVWRYTAPEFASFQTPLFGSPCRRLPMLMALSMVNVTLIVSLIILTIWAVVWDLQIRRNAHKRHRRDTTQLQVTVDDVKLVDGSPKLTTKLSRRWTIGVGQILWEFESNIAAKKMH